MNIVVRQVEYQAVEAMRELYRQEANCQIIHDTYLKRGLADAYLIWVNERLTGYCAVSNNDDRKRVTEFYTVPEMRSLALPMLRKSISISQATQIEAQTNIPLMLLLLYDCANNITRDALLFQDAFTTHHECKNGLFRRILPEEANSIFPHHQEPVGNWVIATSEGIVATGGFLTHYNQPYADLFMEVKESARQQGLGSYLVQELKRVCYEAGKKPAARCDPTNLASRLTLQKAGFLPCGYLLVGEINPTI